MVCSVRTAGRRLALLSWLAAMVAGCAPAETEAGPASELVRFVAADGLEVTADFYPGKSPKAPVVLLFHQSSSSRGEFQRVAPLLQGLGYNALAVDLRWGDQRNGVVNETARRHGTRAIIASIEAGTGTPWPTIDASYQDMEAALAWAESHGLTGRRYVLGSSFSAMLVFRLAAEHEVAGVLAYSPGEYDESRPTLVRGWAASVKAPVLSVAAVDEAELVRPVADAVTSTGSRFVQAPVGSHGASILGQDRRNWITLASFLGQHDGGPPERVELTVTAGTDVPVMLDDYDAFLDGPGAPYVAVLFHQGGGSGRGEYGFLIPRLLDLGIDVVTADLYGGGDRFGFPNRTMLATPEPETFNYCDALPQVRAVLAYVQARRPGANVIAWGSSYSAALVLQAAASGPTRVGRVLAFSPATGEPMDGCAPEIVVGNLEMPVLVVRPRSEAELPDLAQQLDMFRKAGHHVVVADPGAHGASTLNPFRVNGDVSAAWDEVYAFLFPGFVKKTQ